MTCCCLTAGVLLISGCSPTDPTVTGTIRVDGDPLDQGSIQFVPVDDRRKIATDHGPGGGTTIKGGKYRIEKGMGLRVGRYRVEIQGTRRTTRQVPDPINASVLVPEEVAVVPPKYNQKSTLFREVKAGANTHD